MAEAGRPWIPPEDKARSVAFRDDETGKAYIVYSASGNPVSKDSLREVANMVQNGQKVPSGFAVSEGFATVDPDTGQLKDITPTTAGGHLRTWLNTASQAAEQFANQPVPQLAPETPGASVLNPVIN